jgi:hypothetical protein
MRPRSLASVLLPVVLVAACGGSDGLPKEEFVERAEALCSSANDALDNEPQPESPEQITPYFERLLTTAEETTTELEELAADQPDEEEISRIFLTPLRGQVEVLQGYLPKVEEAVQEGEQGLAELPEPELPEADASAMRDYGFDACLETAQTD